MVMEMGQLEGGSQVRGGAQMEGVAHWHRRKTRGCRDYKGTKHGTRVKRQAQVTKGLMVKDTRNAHKKRLIYSPDCYAQKLFPLVLFIIKEQYTRLLLNIPLKGVTT